MVIPRWLQTYIDESALKAVESQIQAIELKTEAEIVPVVVRASSQYYQAHITLKLIGLIFFCLFWSITDWQAHWDHFYTSLGIVALWMILIFIGLPQLMRFDCMKRWLTVKAEEVEQSFKRAEIEFYENRVNQTGDSVGVLLFISVLEHSVIVLADKKISDKLPQDIWQNIVDDMVAELRQKKMAEALQKGLQRVGQLLIEHFPVKSGDTNELPNKVIVKE